MIKQNTIRNRQKPYLSLFVINCKAIFLNVLFLLGTVVFPTIHQYQVNCTNTDCSIKCSSNKQDGSNYTSSHHEAKHHDSEHCPICHISMLAKEQPNLEIGLYKSGKVTLLILPYRETFALNFITRSSQPRAPPQNYSIAG